MYFSKIIVASLAVALCASNVSADCENLSGEDGRFKRVDGPNANEKPCRFWARSNPNRGGRNRCGDTITAVNDYTGMLIKDVCLSSCDNCPTPCEDFEGTFERVDGANNKPCRFWNNKGRCNNVIQASNEFQGMLIKDVCPLSCNNCGGDDPAPVAPTEAPVAPTRRPTRRPERADGD